MDWIFQRYSYFSFICFKLPEGKIPASEINLYTKRFLVYMGIRGYSVFRGLFDCKNTDWNY